MKNVEQLKHYIADINNCYNNYIYAEDIIPEESKEYTQSMTLNNINKTINKIIMNKNKNEESDSDNSSIISNKIIKNKKDDNKLNNYINLNMTINLNFNFDKIYNLTDDIKYNSDREINNKDKNERFARGKGFLSTGNLPYLIIKSIQEEADSSGKKIEKDNVYKSNKKLEISNDFIQKEYLPTI